MRVAFFAAVLLLAFGCSYSHAHPGLARCHAHPAAPGHTVHDHDTNPTGNLIEYDLRDADGNRGVGVSGPCEED